MPSLSAYAATVATLILMRITIVFVLLVKVASLKISTQMYSWSDVQQYSSLMFITSKVCEKTLLKKGSLKLSWHLKLKRLWWEWHWQWKILTPLACLYISDNAEASKNLPPLFTSLSLLFPFFLVICPPVSMLLFLALLWYAPYQCICSVYGVAWSCCCCRLIFSPSIRLRLNIQVPMYQVSRYQGALGYMGWLFHWCNSGPASAIDVIGPKG